MKKTENPHNYVTNPQAYTIWEDGYFNGHRDAESEHPDQALRERIARQLAEVPVQDFWLRADVMYAWITRQEQP
jgi:hypothetical protein